LQFYDQSSDPGQVGFSSESWDFGDGTTMSNPGCCPQHRYAADGDYTVKLDVTTMDGRTASTSQVVHVRTHDVAITKFTVPQSASSGQTRSITVNLTNHRYDENVQVQLIRSVAGGGFVPVGTSTRSVPVRGGNRTTDFAFNYTFTKDDAALGKVTFEAVATITDARDSQSADNTAIALPTKVGK
jgi:PKD repeat protein